MKASWNWLRDYVGVKAPAAEVAERLTMAGLIVETIEETPEDLIFEIEITSNRPDWLSHLGIAREIAAIYSSALKDPRIELPAGSGDVAELASLDVLADDLCSLYTARVITGVKVAESPSWLVEKVESVGLRSVNNVVDITNFVMYECGQPLHAFDLARLGGGGAKIVVRRAKNGEELRLIDGTRHELVSTDLVIADARHPVALAGVMGGARSEIGDETTDILLESARFDPYCIRMTAKRLGVSSDASYRFERGVDLETVDWASRRAAALIVKIAGGELAGGELAAGRIQPPRREITLRQSHMRRLLGLAIPIDRARAILSSLGFVIRGGSPDETLVEIPSLRADVKEEVDLIEEVARIHGYDKIPFETNLKIGVGEKTARERSVEAAEAVLTAAGFHGCISYSLMTGGLARDISPWSDGEPVYLENRGGHENTLMRPSLIASLLEVRKTNEDRKVLDPDVYEVAHIYLPSDGEIPDQPLAVSALTGGDFAFLKGVLMRMLVVLGAGEARFEPAEFSFLADGRSARIVLDGVAIGCVGELADEFVRRMDLRKEVCVAEVLLSSLEGRAHEIKSMESLSRFPGVERDLALVVDEKVTWADVISTVEAAGVEHLEQIAFVSLYRGEPIPDGKKSVAVHVVFRSAERTLTGDEADASQATMLQALSSQVGASLR